MLKEIEPAGTVDAVIECPPSKGYTNRALVVAGLAEGKSVLSNVLVSEDTMLMVEGLKALGIEIELESNTAVVYGVNGKPKTVSGRIFVGNSGTTARFLTAVAALNRKVIIDGAERMRERPMQDLADALNSLGASVSSSNGCLPLEVKGVGINGGRVAISGETSSQFLSALLMISPYFERNAQITITGKLTSKPFIDMTTQVMKDFGGEVINQDYSKFEVVAGKKYNARSYLLEGDAANATYFFAAAAITGGKVRVGKINPYSVQGEIGFVKHLEKMGCKVERGENWIEVKGSMLKGLNVDMNDMPDAVQTLAVVAAFAKSNTTITNIENLRLKETDRIAALASELRKLGAEVKELKDGLEITPRTLHGATISTYYDHRMAMSFAVAGLAVKGIRIENPSCVRKTFPKFFTELEKLK